MRILGSRILIVLCPWHDADCFLSQHDTSDASWDSFTPDRLNEGRGRRMRRLCARAVRGVTYIKPRTASRPHSSACQRPLLALKGPAGSLVCGLKISLKC